MIPPPQNVEPLTFFLIARAPDADETSGGAREGQRKERGSSPLGLYLEQRRDWGCKGVPLAGRRPRAVLPPLHYPKKRSWGPNPLQPLRPNSDVWRYVPGPASVQAANPPPWAAPRVPVPQARDSPLGRCQRGKQPSLPPTSVQGRAAAARPPKESGGGISKGGG